MKKETVNTFNEGLNKDLNPIVTPNNVLTDNLNGTFITFNGDELSLQNDAGNTKIPVKWDERLSVEYVEGSSYNSGVIVKTTNDSDEIVMFKSMKDHNTDSIWREDGSINTDSWELFDPVVKLSKGFYPIGMKEYGGVLYIVSGKKGYNDLGERVKELDEIEFGSYPSPSNSGYKTFHGEKTIELIYDPYKQNILYKSFIINDDYFKTGRYITFNIIDNINLDVSNVQTETETGIDDTKLYIIKLYLQLDNGVIDLTDDVWTKFRHYKTQNPDDTATHWLLSPGFEYYCPYSYNGKLSVKTVMSEPTVELTKISTTENDSGLYSLSFDVNIKDTNALSVDKCVLKYWYKSGDTFSQEKSVDTESLSQEINSFIIDSIPGNEEILYYEIKPYFKYKDTVLEWNDFPLEFKQLYMIKGTVMLADKFKDIGFNSGDYECIPREGIRKIKELILVGKDGFLNPDLEYISEEDKPYAFFLSGHSNDAFISLGTYTVKNSYVDVGNITQTPEEASILDMSSDIYINVIKPVLRDTLVERFDPSCSDSILKLRFSAPLDMTDPKTLKNGTLTIFQDIKGSVNSLGYESIDGRNFNIKINAFENVTLSFDHPVFGSFNHTIDKETLNTDKVYEIGLAVYFKKLILDWGDSREILSFKTPKLDESISELGLYIHDKFSTNISDRYQITPQDSAAGYTFPEQRISYSDHLRNFYTTVNDPYYLNRWINAYAVPYPYKLTDNNGEVLNSNIAEGEYIAITNKSNHLISIGNEYIKIGTDSLGYVLFKIEGNLTVGLSSYN